MFVIVFVVPHIQYVILLGYSWLSNQYGLTIDNVVAYELVLPSGVVTTVTETSNPDLWFGLRVSIH